LDHGDFEPGLDLLITHWQHFGKMISMKTPKSIRISFSFE
jgi:hypothetical protein